MEGCREREGDYQIDDCPRKNHDRYPKLDPEALECDIQHLIELAELWFHCHGQLFVDLWHINKRK